MKVLKFKNAQGEFEDLYSVYKEELKVKIEIKPSDADSIEIIVPVNMNEHSMNKDEQNASLIFYNALPLTFTATGMAQDSFGLNGQDTLVNKLGIGNYDYAGYGIIKRNEFLFFTVYESFEGTENSLVIFEIPQEQSNYVYDYISKHSDNGIITFSKA